MFWMCVSFKECGSKKEERWEKEESYLAKLIPNYRNLVKIVQ
jgi:hypothetical protein